MEIEKIIEKGKVNALNNFKVSLNEDIVFIKKEYSDVLVEKYIKLKVDCNNDKILDSFRLVLLNEEIISKKISNLSSSEKLKIELAIKLIKNEELIILYQFDKYFMEKDLFYFKKLFKKLVLKYNKTVALIDCNFAFNLDFIDRLVFLNDKNEIKTYTKEDFYNDEITNFIDNPKIISFVKYVNRNKKILDNYTDIKELIKGIFREV